LSPAHLPPIRERLEFICALLDGKEVPALRPREAAGKNTWGRVDRVRLLGAEQWGKLPLQLAVMGLNSAEAVGEFCDVLKRFANEVIPHV
jgi:hypothetical protein